MATLSLCMIVKNEAETLTPCLESVRPFVDEMIVVDTGSTDDTVAIARRLGAKVEFYEWTDDFAAARNAALQWVTGDWVLVLDADERLAPGAGPVLRQAIEQQTHGLVINLVRYEVGAKQSPYSLVSRLFRRHPKIHFTRPYHAMIDDTVAELLLTEPDWTIQDLPDPAILHEGYQSEAIANRNKAQTARLTMERFLTQNPGDPYVCSKLGALYLELDRPTYGIELLERGLKSKDLNPPITYELHYHLGIAYSKMKCVAQAAHHYQQAIQQPILPSLKLGAYTNLGSLQQAMGDLQGAATAFETVIDLAPALAVGYYNLGMNRKMMGLMQEAIGLYQKAIQLQPDYAEAHQNLGVTLLKLGQVQAGLDAFKRAIALHKRQNPQEAERLQQGLADMGFRV